MLVFYYDRLVETNVLRKRKPHLQYIIQTVYDVVQFRNVFYTITIKSLHSLLVTMYLLTVQ